MHGHNDERQTGMVEEMRRTFNAAHALTSFCAAPLAALLAKPGTMGQRFQDSFGMLAGLVMQVVVVALAGGSTATEQAAVVTGLTLTGLLSQRLHRGKLRRQGYRTHSMSRGIWPLAKDQWAAQGTVCPTVVTLVGFAVVGFAPGAGLWCMMAGFSQAVCVSLERHELRARARAMDDARFDQRAVLQQREDDDR